MATKNLPVPDGIGPAGKSVWAAITSAYALRPDELATLEDVCSITDMISALNAAWIEDGNPLTTKGSMGQQVIHPLIGEIRTQKMARNSLWRQLKLPDAAAGAGQANQARSAAQSRWSSAHGSGA